MSENMLTGRNGVDTEVLIVGGGPTGLVMAGELARRGVRPRIVDVARGATDLSKALGVQARTLEVFENMGIDRAFPDRGNHVTGANFYDGYKKLLHLSFAGLDSAFPYVLVIPQAETERALIRNLDRLGVEVERETRLTGMAQDEAGVTATLEHADGRTETIRCSWLVGCDGAHSTVRHALDLPFTGEEYAEGFVLADVRIDWPRTNREFHLFVRDGWIFGAIPLPDGYWRVVADVPPEQAPRDQAPTLEQVQAIARERGVADAVLSDPVWTSNYRIHRRIVSQLQKGRVFLVGDAAHIHNPAGGQGMNTGIQDAFNLAWKLALVVRGASAPALLESYHAERYPVEKAVLLGTDLALKMISLKHPVAQAVRDRLLMQFSGLGAVQGRLRRTISEVGIGYPKSPIVENHYIGGGPVAGDRAPDASGSGPDGERLRLYELMQQGNHTLLLFGGTGGGEEVPELLRLAGTLRQSFGEHLSPHLVVAGERQPEAWESPVILDRDGSFHARYGAVPTCLFLIRPDGYIAYRARVAEARRTFPRYLRRIFSGVQSASGG